jgi:hypothetical protein
VDPGTVRQQALDVVPQCVTVRSVSNPRPCRNFGGAYRIVHWDLSVHIVTDNGKTGAVLFNEYTSKYLYLERGF